MKSIPGKPKEKRHGTGRLGQQAKRWLVDYFQDRVRFQEPMSRHTSFRVGGYADAFITVRQVLELVNLVGFCRDNGLPYLVVGDGTNLLVSDAGIRGVVITLASRFREIQKVPEEGTLVTVRSGAGARTRMLCRYAVDAGLSGMNFAVGIPGTVGGALTMNAGTPQGCMADVVAAVAILHADGTLRAYGRGDLFFAYRSMQIGSEFVTGSTNGILLSADFKLKKSKASLLKAEAAAILKLRRDKQPWRSPSAGCFFKNPPGSRSAGELIDLAGLKGKAVGGARVSPRHANFIVNTGDATASDILKLACAVQEKVSKNFGIRLEAEVKLVGNQSQEKSI